MSSSAPFHLSKNPIALVLCQIRFSGIMGLESAYIPEIQARLRVLGFKINETRQVPQVVMTPQGPQALAVKTFEFQSVDRGESVVITPDFVTYQATRYVSFQEFLARLIQVVDEVAAVTNGLTVERLGLRYLDVVSPRRGETWQLYIQPGLRGVSSPFFKAQTDEQIHQIVTETVNGGAMIIRVMTNPRAVPLPPDLIGSKLAFNIPGPIIDGLGAAVIDVDHFREVAPIEYERGEISKQLTELKDPILTVWKDHIVTHEALEIWA